MVSLAGACRGLLYHPTGLDGGSRAALAARPGWAEATLELDPGPTLVGLVARPERPGASWILYFGGNAMSLDGSQRILERIRGENDAGLAVFAYRGYDGSGGRPTQRRLTDDGVAIARALEGAGATPDRLVIVGQSLGSGVATQVVARLQGEARTPAGLVLVSPFTSVPAAARAHVPCAPGCLFPDRWRSLRRAPSLRLPVLVLHGTRDEVVPVEHGRALAAAIPGAELVEVGERGHDDLWDARVIGRVRAWIRAHVPDGAF